MQITSKIVDFYISIVEFRIRLEVNPERYPFEVAWGFIDQWNRVMPCLASPPGPELNGSSVWRDAMKLLNDMLFRLEQLYGEGLILAVDRFMNGVPFVDAESAPVIVHAPQLVISAGKPEVKPATRGKNVEARMMKLCNDEPEGKLEWTAEQWADALECSKSTVVETGFWRNTLSAQKALSAASRTGQTDGRRTPRNRG